MEKATAQRLQRLLGLGLRGRLAVAGVDQVKAAAHRGRLRLAVLATDAAANSREKLAGLLAARGVPVIELLGADELGEVAGRERTAVIGVLDAQLAKGILALDGVAGASLKVSGRMG